MERIALYNDSFQNWKSHDIQKAQLILTDIPYQLGTNAYGSNPMWYEGGDNSNGESKYAKSSFFDTDSKAGFRIPEFFHFCNNLLKIHPTQKPVSLLESIIRTFTDVDDVVIDCCAGSGTTLLTAANLNRRAYGFELKKNL